MTASQHETVSEKSVTTSSVKDSPSLLVITARPEPSAGMTVFLSQAGYRVLTATDAQEGLILAELERPDLVICDDSVTEISAVEFCRRLRATAEPVPPQVLLVVAERKDTASANDFISAAADDYLQVPYEPRHLVAKIEHLLTRYSTAEAVKSAQQQLRLITDKAPVYIAHCDIDRRYKFVNKGYAERLGFERKELIGKRVIDVLGPVVYENIKGYMDTALGGQPVEFEIELPYEQPGTRYMHCSYEPELDERGEVKGFIGVLNDITERRRAEEALSESEARLRLVTSQVPAFLWATDRDLRVTYSAGAGHALTSTAPAQFIGVTVYEVNQTDEDTHPHVAAHLLALQGVSSKFESGWMGRTLETYLTPLRSADNKIIGAIGLSVDITERKQMEDELRTSERQLADAQRLACVGSWSLDLQTQSRTWSEEFYRILGVDPSEPVPTMEEFLTRFVHPDDRELVRTTVEHFFRTHEPYSYFRRLIRTDGEVRIVHSRGSVVYDEKGNAVRLVGASQDVTEQKMAEEQLRRTTEQLRALSASLHSAREEEAARIAREIHDELGAALSSLRWDLEEIHESISETGNDTLVCSIRGKIAAMLQLTDTTVNTVRRISSDLRPATLDNLGLVEAIEWQAQQFTERTGITVCCDCHLENLALSREQSTALFRIFQEALTNVLRHAHASRVDVGLKEDVGSLIMRVRDDGRGIRKEDITGQSTLGLLGMRERAALIGAEFDVCGVEGEKTVVTVRVPTPVMS